MACEGPMLYSCFPSSSDGQLLYGSDYQKEIRAVAICRDGGFFAVAQGDHVDLWDATKTPRPTLYATLTAHVGPVTTAAIRPDNQTIATAGADGRVLLG